MGNASQRMVSARVIRPDGIIVEYDYSIQVAMLMALHPDYLVIHCSDDAVAPGERRHIKVLDPEERLSLGQCYIMYPIPSQYKEIVNAAPVQTVKPSGSRFFFFDLRPRLKFTLARFMMRTSGKGTRSRRLWRLKVSARSRPVAPGKVKDGGRGPLLDFDSTDQSSTRLLAQSLQDQQPDLTVDPSFWKLARDDPAGSLELPSMTRRSLDA